MAQVLLTFIDHDRPNSSELMESSCLLTWYEHSFIFVTGALSVTRSKAMARVDIPVLDWPKAPFPYLEYPLDKHERENKAEEERCLELVINLVILDT